jgi:hypothetical protein
LLLSGCVWNTTDDESSYLPLDDSEYPYAGVPRIVIETENFSDIRDEETEIASRFQLYGENEPSSPVVKLTVRGRGYTSFKNMAKSGLKLEFEDKQYLVGMPGNKDWVLVANYADRTHLRNFISYKLADWLSDDYAPRAQFVELYFNREYMGLYLLVESVKVGKNRVNISESETSFLLEKNATRKKGDVIFKTDSGGFYFKICYPKAPSMESQQLIKKHIDDFEVYLRGRDYFGNNPIDEWMDLDDYFRFYWIQEYAKNYDGAFRRSIFLTWEKNGLIKWGPIWDFDGGYGNWSMSDMPNPSNWYVRDSGWNRWLFRNEKIKRLAADYWMENRGVFNRVLDSIDMYANQLNSAVLNDFKRWPILAEGDASPFRVSYDSYGDAVDSLKAWIKRRSDWIDAAVGREN